MDGRRRAHSSRAVEQQSSRVPEGGATALELDRSAALPRYQPLVTVLTAIAAGIVFDRYTSANLFGRAGYLYWLATATCLITWLLVWRRRYDWLAAWPLLMAAALAGATWHHAHWHLYDRHHVGRYARFDASPACFEAIARESPSRVPAPQPTPLRAIPATERSRLTIEVVGIRDGTRWRPASGTCQLTVEGHLLGVRPGDRLRIFGQLARLEPPRNPGEFDFAARARADRQLARLRSSAPESVTVLGRGNFAPAVTMLDAIRSAGLRQIRQFVGPERTALASAILLGMRDAMPNEETASFFITGTIHLLVVSGLHVGILALGLYLLMGAGWLPRRTGLAVIIAVVVAYALVAQARPPVVRGATLTVLVCLAAWNGRRAVAFNSLAAAALVVLLINPAELFQTGTQLSFLAVATLITVYNLTRPQGEAAADPLDQIIESARPWYERLLRPLARWIGWFFMATGAVWLASLPLVLHRFNVAAPVAVLIQPVVWGLVVVALWSGFLLLAVGWLVPMFGSWCGALCNRSLAGLEAVVQWAEALPAGHLWSPGPAWWWVVVFYLGLLVVMIRGRAIAPPRWQVAALALWILVGLAPPLVRGWTRDSLDCTFVAVGHGTCVVLEAPNGQTLLYDAGALAAPEFVTQTIASYLWHRGIRRVDALVLSHADLDHYNAVPGLLKRFRVGAVYVSPVMFDGFGAPAGGAPELLRAAIESAGVPIRDTWSGDTLRVGDDMTIHVLHPPRRGVVGNNNANSITMAVEYGGRRLLLPGDLESPGLEDVLAELPLPCDIVMAPHHGSRFSDPPGFAAWCTPRYVVISGAGRSDVISVVETYQRAGALVLHTHETGAVQFCIAPQNGPIEVTTWRTAAEQ